MTDPKILILDEPCEGLDLAAREHFLKNLEMIAHSDLAPTIIFITIMSEEILPLFTQIMILKDGNIFKKGEIQQLLSSNLYLNYLIWKLQLKCMMEGFSRLLFVHNKDGVNLDFSGLKFRAFYY